MAGSGFQVNVASGFSNPDVQNLSETEKSLARGMGLSEEQFRQNKIEYLLGEERRRERGRDLGEHVQAILSKVGPGYGLRSVTWNGDTLSWTLGIDTPQGAQNVVLSWDLVNDVLDSRTRTQMHRLRNMVLFGLGLRDLIFEKH